MNYVNDTDMQYKSISGNWGKYFSRLCNQKHRKGVISKDDCLAILERQNGRCALSGEMMTCRLEKGVSTLTNASLDRIDAKGSYHPDNVQLICVVLNRFRTDAPLGEFVEWCRKVTKYADEKTQLCS